MNQTPISALSSLGAPSQKRVNDRTGDSSSDVDALSQSGFLPAFANAISDLMRQQPQETRLEDEPESATTVVNEADSSSADTDTPGPQSLPSLPIQDEQSAKLPDSQISLSNIAAGIVVKQGGLFPVDVDNKEIAAMTLPVYQPMQALESAEGSVPQQPGKEQPSSALHTEQGQDKATSSEKKENFGNQIPSISFSNELLSGVDVPAPSVLRLDTKTEFNIQGQGNGPVQLPPDQTNRPAAPVVKGSLEATQSRVLTLSLQDVNEEKSVQGPEPQHVRVYDGARQEVGPDLKSCEIKSIVQTTLSRMLAQSSLQTERASQSAARGVPDPALSTVSSSAILGNGERILLYQIAKQNENLHGGRNNAQSSVTSRINTPAPVAASNTADGTKGLYTQQTIDSERPFSPVLGRTVSQIDEKDVNVQRHSNALDQSFVAKDPESTSAAAAVTGPGVPLKRALNAEHENTEMENEVTPPTSEPLRAVGESDSGSTKTGLHNQSSSRNSASPSHETVDGPATPTAGVVNEMRSSEEGQKPQPAQMVELGQTVARSVSDNGSVEPTSFMPGRIGDQTIASLVSENLVNGISSEVAQRLRDGVSELTLQLKPESLGEMRLKIGIVDDKVTAQIQVTEHGVKAALETNMPQLRDGLASQGVEVQRIEILMVGDAPAREFRGQQEARQKAFARRRENDNAEERFQGARLMGYNTIEMVM